VVDAVVIVVLDEVSIGVGGGVERVSSRGSDDVDAVYAGRRAHQIFDFT
jgi:hypothetical protein